MTCLTGRQRALESVSLPTIRLIETTLEPRMRPSNRFKATRKARGEEKRNNEVETPSAKRRVP
jgi:hypothetical protein